MINASNFRARSIVASLFVIMLFVPLTVCAAAINFESETILRVFERNTAQKNDAKVLPVYEYLRGAVGSGEEVVSFHLSGWGRFELADEGYFEDAGDGELMYGYLEYRPAGYNVNLRAGRQYVFAGVANEAVDGVSVSAEAKGGMLFSVYGGLPVGLTDTDGAGGDMLVGGRVAHRSSLYQFGLSYKLVENDSATAQEQVGSDLALFLPGRVNLTGLSRYNIETEDFAEHSYEANIGLGPVNLRPFVERYRYEDYFNAGAKTVNPFRFLAIRDETLTVAGSDVSYNPAEDINFMLRAKALDYEIADTAIYASAMLTSYSDGVGNFGAEVGRLEGDLDRDSYTLSRLFAYLEDFNQAFPIEFISADMMLAIYDEDIRGEGEAYFLSLGAGKNLMKGDLRLKAAAEYSSDPYYTEDLRGSVSATYLFAP